MTRQQAGVNALFRHFPPQLDLKTERFAGLCFPLFRP
jgi:hypothetical protein